MMIYEMHHKDAHHAKRMLTRIDHLLGVSNADRVKLYIALKNKGTDYAY